MTAEERLQPTELMPEMATLDCGTVNFGDEVFENTLPMMRAFGKRMIDNHIKPEYECFDIGPLGGLATSNGQRGEAPGHPMQFNFVLGVAGTHLLLYPICYGWSMLYPKDLHGQLQA